mmetsp:Transcript_17963/g.42337  ORF Transcript_17963/g.42337 Transcript_17963/m.42337 type:complete len:252 (-) Transcript_17963:196-951(-)
MAERASEAAVHSAGVPDSASAMRTARAALTWAWSSARCSSRRSRVDCSSRIRAIVWACTSLSFVSRAETASSRSPSAPSATRARTCASAISFCPRATSSHARVSAWSTPSTSSAVATPGLMEPLTPPCAVELPTTGDRVEKLIVAPSDRPTAKGVEPGRSCARSAPFPPLASSRSCCVVVSWALSSAASATAVASRRPWRTCVTDSAASKCARTRARSRRNPAISASAPAPDGVAPWMRRDWTSEYSLCSS